MTQVTIQAIESEQDLPEIGNYLHVYSVLDGDSFIWSQITQKYINLRTTQVHQISKPEPQKPCSCKFVTTIFLITLLTFVGFVINHC